IHFETNPPPAYKLQWNFNVERQITRGLSITAAYVGARGVHLPAHVNDINQVPAPLVKVAPAGNLLFPTTGPIQRINPNFSVVPGTSWYGYAIYHALQVNVSQRFTHGFSFQGVYGW